MDSDSPNRLIDVSLDEARELKKAFSNLFAEAIEETARLPVREMNPEKRLKEEWMRPRDLSGENEAEREKWAWLYPNAKVTGPDKNYKLDTFGGLKKGRHLVGIVFYDDGTKVLVDNPETDFQRILYDKIDSYLNKIRSGYSTR